jgi:hypothetical protein
MRELRILAVTILTVLFLPVLIKILDFSRFVIFTASTYQLWWGMIRYFFRHHFVLSLAITILSFTLAALLFYKITKRGLWKNLLFLAGLIVFLAEVLPFVLLKSTKPELLYFYISVFIVVFLFSVLTRVPYDFLLSFSRATLILFPLFALFLFIGFNSSAARPKKTILNGGPEHNLLDERCDRKMLLSQPFIKPIWIEDAWLYGGVATRDGRYLYFSDNGYGIVGFELQENGEYKRLPFINYPKDFKAALYSHRLYLTPDERYIYYFGARSAEFVFIDRERWEVAYIIPTKNGLDGFSCTMDTKRNLIYGFPFIGKEVPVLSYENGVPRLIKWVDFSNISGWAIQGEYIWERDWLLISTSESLNVFSGDLSYGIRKIENNSFPKLLFISKDHRKAWFIYIFWRDYITELDLDSFNISNIPAIDNLKEIVSCNSNRWIYMSEVTNPYVIVMNIDTGIRHFIYVGPKPRGLVCIPLENGYDRLFVGSGCGALEVDLKSLIK